MAPSLQPPTDAMRAHRRLWCLASAPLPLLFVWADQLIVGHFVFPTFWIRLGWSLGLGALGLVGWGKSAAGFRWSIRLATLGSALFYCLVVWNLGVAWNPLYGWISVLPMVANLVGRDDPTNAVAATAVSVGAALAIGAGWGAAAPQLLLATALVSCAGALATASATLNQRQVRTQEEAISQLAQSERRRARAERLATVGGLAGGVAHEINNPLGYVKSNLQVLREELSGARTLPDEELETMWSEANQGLERIRTIVNDLRTFARDDDEVVGETCILSTVVEEAVRLASVRLTGRVKIEVDVPVGLPPIKIKHQKLSQVLLNLLINVADALDERPAVGGGKVQIAVSRKGDRIRIVVEDNGPGFSEGVLARLFEPFFTTKSPGRGTRLGLAISREFLQRSGGSLTAENRAEGGARFILVLPTG